MWKKISDEKPNHDQLILIKCRNQPLPEVGIWSNYGDNESEVYIPSNDESETIENIEYWMEIPDIK